MDFYALDIETAPRVNEPQVYALQPWRVKEYLAFITHVAVCDPNGGSKVEEATPYGNKQILGGLNGRCVATWNGLFDVAWFFAEERSTGLHYGIENVRWIDAMLLWKWHDNGQRYEFTGRGRSLEDGAEHWLRDWPLLGSFQRLKQNAPPPGQHDQYWSIRARMDAVATQMIATRAWAALAPQQRRGALLEAESITEDARAWVDGIAVDAPRAEEMAGPILEEMESIEVSLGVRGIDWLKTSNGYVQYPLISYDNPSAYAPTPILASPEKLAYMLFVMWKLKPVDFSEKTKNPKADKAALSYLADFDERVIEVMRWRELNTQYTKFIKGIRKTTEYLKERFMHPSPAIFSTYTGRQTYRSKSGSKGEAAKAYIGAALHQWPRNKEMRKLIMAP